MRCAVLAIAVGGCRLGFEAPSASTADGSIGNADGVATVDPFDAAPPIAGAVYATANNELFTVDPTTGASMSIGPLPCATAARDLALSRAGELLVLSGNALYVVDPATAACSLRATISNTSAPIVALAYARNGSSDELLGGTNPRPGKLYRLDPGTGVGTEVGSYGGGYFSRGDLTTVTGVGLLASVTSDTGGDWLARVDRTTGVATILGATATYYGLVATSSGLYAFAPDGAIARLDPTDGSVIASKPGAHAWTGVALAPLAP